VLGADGGTHEFRDAEQAETSSLAEAIFEVAGMRRQLGMDA
jgi:hypothetical protein